MPRTVLATLSADLISTDSAVSGPPMRVARTWTCTPFFRVTIVVGTPFNV